MRLLDRASGVALMRSRLVAGYRAPVVGPGRAGVPAACSRGLRGHSRPLLRLAHRLLGARAEIGPEATSATAASSTAVGPADFNELARPGQVALALATPLGRRR